MKNLVHKLQYIFIVSRFNIVSRHVDFFRRRCHNIRTAININYQHPLILATLSVSLFLNYFSIFFQLFQRSSFVVYRFTAVLKLLHIVLWLTFFLYYRTFRFNITFRRVCFSFVDIITTYHTLSQTIIASFSLFFVILSILSMSFFINNVNFDLFAAEHTFEISKQHFMSRSSLFSTVYLFIFLTYFWIYSSIALTITSF